MVQDVAMGRSSLPTKPSLPPPLQRLLSDGLREVRDIVRADPSWRPPSVDQPTIVAIAEIHIPALERYLDPAKIEAISGRVTVLLSHFYVAEHAEGVGPGVIHDWLDALEPYPMWAIQQACKDWLAMHRERPMVADIRKECDFWVSDARAELDLLRKLIAAQPKPDVPATTY